MTGVRVRLQSVPFYPALFFAAWMVALFITTPYSLNALIRPLAIGTMIVVVAQIALSGLTYRRHYGAMLVTLLAMSLLDLGQFALVLVLVWIAAMVVAVIRGYTAASLPWSALTRWLNVVSAITVALVLIQGSVTGGLIPSQEVQQTAGARPSGPMPDIYLILLDAYPRSDTLARDFGFDNGPFIEQMKGLGFETSTKSRSNYNLTALTLASMFNMVHVERLPGIREVYSVTSEYRLLAQAINRGRAFDALASAGYETLAVPSGFSFVTTYSVDRLLDGGQMTDFEYDILQRGALRKLLPDWQRQVLTSQQRGRVTGAFETLRQLANERADHPRFIFAHVPAPHPPIIFGQNGEPREGWPCFPERCGMFSDGEAYGDAVKGPIKDEVAYINTLVISVAEAILTKSQTPPIVVFLSDHGSRFNLKDPDESLRSFFIASTPGHPRLFPTEVTPVNLIPRILNAYGGYELPLESEESFWVDVSKTGGDDPPFDLIPWIVQDPED